MTRPPTQWRQRRRAQSTLDRSRICANYTFGSKYAHLVDKLALFAKTVGASARMGQEFTTALVDSNSRGGSSLEPCVRLRAGCMAVKLTASEVVDGVYGLMSGSDIRKLLTMPEAPAFEAAFQHADEVVQALAGIVEEKVLVASECALWIRTIEFAIKLWTPQCTKNELESFEHIKAKFAHEIAIYMHRHNQGLKGTKKVKNPCVWEVPEASNVDSEGASTVQQEGSAVVDPNDHAYILYAQKT